MKLQTPETIKIFGSTKKLIYKAKNGENVPSLELVEVFLVQCSLVDNQYRQNSLVLYTFMLLDTGLDALKTVSKRLVYKAAETAGEFIENKIADKIVKPKHVIDENPRMLKT